jgi:DNA-binding PadR family transcriptional regulator
MEFDHRDYWEMLINRSVSRFFLLAALHQRAMHGYELAKAIAEACRGCCEPSDAMIYPALHDLLEGGYVVCEVEAQGARQRKVCRLSEKGEEAYRAAAGAWQRIMPALEEAVAAASLHSEVGECVAGACAPATVERRTVQS